MSKIEVNEIDAQSGSTITVGSACKSVAVPGNVVKTNAVQASDAGNIISQSGTTITIGASGDTVSLASGASQSGFGRSGSVDWQTGSIKTGNFTAANGEGYFVDTSSGAVTASLPAGTAGAIVAFADYTRTFNSNNLTVSPNGTQKIGGIANDLILSVDGQALTLVYVDDTEGWINVQNAEDTESGQVPGFIAATGGTVTTVCTNFKVHTFTGPGTFCVSCAGNSLGANKVSFMVIAGGGEGGSAAPSNGAGGGGAGGYRESKSPFCSYTASPTASTCGLAVTGGIPITVGAGGAQQPQPANNLGNPGSNSIFSTITSAGGGGGKIDSPAGEPATAGDGGSGGGGAASASSPRRPGGSGNEPSVTPAQGTDGGSGGTNADSTFGGGGGGGAGGVGGNVSVGSKAGNGGDGVSSTINGTPTTRAGGGGASASNAPLGSGGRGLAGPGGGGIGGFAPNGDGGSGTVNTGGGGGAGGFPAAGSARGGGGSGIVIIRYKFQ